MIVRQSTIEDVPEIVALLKQSIGEMLTPKTEAYYLWKHEKNPFGRSKVLLAVENEKIVGLRAFMHWRWEAGQQEISAVRAVDTATDPAFQGKGIFKRLTLQAVEECKAEGDKMVYNSPNAVSMQGYLKMGWSLAGRLPLYIGAGSLFPQFSSPEKANGIYNKFAVGPALAKLGSKWVLPKSESYLTTPLDAAYLAWRYRDCPVAKYGAVIEPGRFGIIFRLKKVNRFIELRLCEVWSEPGFTDIKAAKKACRQLVRQVRPAMVSCSATPLFFSGRKRISRFFGPVKKGPVITIRPLATENLYNFEAFRGWQPSLGAMELF